MQVNDRYDRQIKVAGWDQEKIKNAKVMVLGAGALGNEIVKNLALVGIGNILIVDFDNVELSNLSRTVLFTVEDIGESKAKILAKAASGLNTDLNINYIDGDILFDIGLGFYRNVDLVIGALDNLAARSQASSYAKLAGTHFIDMGVWEHGGEVKWFSPSKSACFDCLLGEHDSRSIAVRRSCTGFKPSYEPDASLIHASTLAPVAIIAGIAIQEICFFICGIRAIRAGEAIVYNGLQLSLHRSFLPRNPNCLNHIDKPYENVHSIPYKTKNITAAELIMLGYKWLGSEVTMELGRDFLLSLTCKHCNNIKEVKKIISRVPETLAYCPNCNHVRKKRIYTAVTSKDEIAGMTLAELGVPIGEVLTLHSNSSVSYFEISEDIVHYYQ